MIEKIVGIVIFKFNFFKVIKVNNFWGRVVIFDIIYIDEIFRIGCGGD